MNANRKSQGWRSPSTDRFMPLVSWGDRGVPVLYVPTSEGDEREFEHYRMHEDCAPWVESGRVRVYSIDGSGPRTLFDDALAPPERIRAYAAFERYVKLELLPWLGEHVPGQDAVLVGASYGAFVVANLWLKLPEIVRVACGLGGVYGMWHRLDGHHDGDVYFHTPLEFLPRLEDAGVLEALRATSGMRLYAAEHDPWLDDTLRFAWVLGEKELPHSVRVWLAPAGHHEHVWREQLRDFLQEQFGPA